MRRSVWTLVMVMSVALTLMASPALAVSGQGGGNQPTFGVDASKVKLGNGFIWSSYGGNHIATVDAVGGDGVLYPIVFSAFGDENINGDVEVNVAESWDNGSLWYINAVVGRGNIYSEGISVATTTITRPHVIWGQYDDTLAIWNLMYNKGRTPQTAVNISGTHNVCYHCISIAGTARDTLNISYTDNSGNVYFINSGNNGATFNTPVPIGTGGQETSIGADAAGNVFLAWDSGPGNIFFSKKLVGETWSTPAMINSTITGHTPSIAVLDDQNIYVAWEGYNGAVVAYTSNGGASWNRSVAGDSSFTSPSLAVDTSSGNSYGDLSVVGNGNDPMASILMYRSTNGGVSWITGPVTVMTESLYPNITVDSQGRAHIMAGDSYNESVYYTREK